MDCFFLNKAELEAKVESLKEETEFLRMFYKEVRSLSIAPAIVCISQLDFQAAYPKGQGKRG